MSQGEGKVCVRTLVLMQEELTKKARIVRDRDIKRGVVRKQLLA